MLLEYWHMVGWTTRLLIVLIVFIGFWTLYRVVQFGMESRRLHTNNGHAFAKCFHAVDSIKRYAFLSFFLTTSATAFGVRYASLVNGDSRLPGYIRMLDQGRAELAILTFGFVAASLLYLLYGILLSALRKWEQNAK